MVAAKEILFQNHPINPASHYDKSEKTLFENLLRSERTLQCAHLAADHPLHPLLSASLTMKKARKPDEIRKKIYWNSERFCLHKSTLFINLPPEVQDQILLSLSEFNLALSYFIEKSALSFAAKMNLLADSCEEKMFYSLLGAEEAMHLQQFRDFLRFEPCTNTHSHPLLMPLAEAIAEGSRDTLTFVIQVLLEGFGIAHYSSLKETCLDDNLRATFQVILKDEARHHGAGLVLTKTRPINQDSRDQIFELSRKFIRSLESAHWIPLAFERAGVNLTEEMTRDLWQQIGFRETLQKRMQKLKEMFLKTNQFELFERLQQNEIFEVQTL